MAEEKDYADVPTTTGPNRGSKPNVTKRVATGILIAALVLAAIIGIRIVESMYYSPLNTFEASTETTTVPATTKQTTTATTKQETTTVPPCVVPCGAGWRLNGTKCYNFSSNRLNWTESRDMCQSLRGHLVKIESREEQTFLFNELIKGDQFWIGLTDSEAEGHWKWTDGSPLDQSLTFWTMEPDNFIIPTYNPEGEDCAAILRKLELSEDKSWADVPCRDTRRFICEKEPICKL